MKFGKTVAFFLLLTLPVFLLAQSPKVKRQQKKLEKTKELKTNEAEMQYLKAVTRHHDIQTKETRKKMKANLKKTRKVYKQGKEGFFIKRWLRIFKKNRQRTKHNSGKKK